MERKWVEHPEHVWVPCWLNKQTGTDAIFATDGGETITVPAAKLASLDPVDDAQLTGVDDVCTLANVTAAALLHTMRLRYSRQFIYTRVQRILISLNPFQPLPIYSSNYLDQYAAATDSMDLPPHIFAIGADAMKGMREGYKDQAVVISGESGAGKTESAKLIMSFVTEAAKTGSQNRGIDEKVLQTNPVLEAFGNAMTVRNNNSSRFGKWLDMQFSSTLSLLGCHINHYLLEVTRVCSQAEGERSYHIFFQLIQARNDAEFSSLKIQPLKSYEYLKHSEPIAPGIDDSKCFDETREAFSSLGFSSDDQLGIFKVVASVLTIGNIKFKAKGEEEQQLADDGPMKALVALLGVNEADLTRSLLFRKLYIGKDVTETPLKEAQAKATRDSLSKQLYGLLFTWLIAKINGSLNLSSGGAKANRLLGILDIAGFESFGTNSIEQLLINLSNEHLQQHFNSFIFKSELDDYAKEGIVLSEAVEYKDNCDCLNLIDGKGGLLDILDEEIAVPKATDMTYVTKVLKIHAKDGRMVVPKFQGKCEFGVSHYAGIVNYTCDGFLEKNANKPPDEAMEVLSASTVPLVKTLVTEIAKDDAGDTQAKSGAKKKATGTSKFRASLRSLMDKIHRADPHYIRCIKPNKEKVPNIFTAKMVMDQLILSGSLEAVRIRQQGFASRLPFKTFVLRYRCLAKLDTKSASETFEPESKTLVDKLCKMDFKPPVPTNNFAFGTTKVFTKASTVAQLEAGRSQLFLKSVVVIQSVARGRKVRKRLASAKMISKNLKDWLTRVCPDALNPPIKSSCVTKLGSLDVAEKELKQIEEMIVKAKQLPYKVEMLQFADTAEKRLRNEIDMIKQVKDLTQSKSTDPVAIDKCLARGLDLGLADSEDFKTLEDRSKKLKVQLPLVHGMKNVLANSDKSMIHDIITDVKSAELDSGTGWLPELDGASLYKKTCEEAKNLPAVDASAPKSSDTQLEVPMGRMESQSSRRSRNSTSTGMGPAAQARILHSLKQAADEYDAVALEQLLGEAVRQGIASGELDPSRQVLVQLQTDSFLQEAVETAKEQATAGNPSPTVLRRLQNLSHQIRALQGDEDLASSAMHLVQNAAQKNANASKRRSVFEATNLEDLQLADGAFKDLCNFAKLKSTKSWKGHRGSKLLSFMGSGQKDSMLVHSKVNIAEALTKVPSELEPAAVQNFRNIMVWMGDKTAQECQRLASRHDVLNLACSGESDIRDEVYVQVMKQLTNNPSPRSALMGWQLTLLLCQAAPPSSDLIEFVRYFLTNAVRVSEEKESGKDLKATDQGDGASATDRFAAEAAGYARECLAALNSKLKESNARATVTQSKSASQDDGNEDVMAIVVHLVDGSSQHMYVPVKMTIGELAVQTGVRLGVRHASDFSFFQLLDGCETPRLLPDHLVVPEMCEKWAQLREATGRSSKLLWRRRFLRTDEVLLAGDLAHAALTFRQALTDFLRKPVQGGDDPDLPAKIGGAILCVEFDHGSDAAVQAKLQEDGFMEKLLPQYVIKEVNTPMLQDQWRLKISEMQRELRPQLGTQTPQIQRMSRMLSLMQGTYLFGSHCWQARQVLNPPSNQTAVAGAPDRVLKFNPWDMEADLYIFVNMTGVHLLPADQNHGSGLQRSFFFRGGAKATPVAGSSGADRLLRWGARPTFLQLVVHAVDPNKPADGRVPLLITLLCTQALDVAFVVHRAIAEESNERVNVPNMEAGSS